MRDPPSLQRHSIGRIHRHPVPTFRQHPLHLHQLFPRLRVLQHHQKQQQQHQHQHHLFLQFLKNQTVYISLFLSFFVCFVDVIIFLIDCVFLNINDFSQRKENVRNNYNDSNKFTKLMKKKSNESIFLSIPFLKLFCYRSFLEKSMQKEYWILSVHNKFFSLTKKETLLIRGL